MSEADCIVAQGATLVSLLGRQPSATHHARIESAGSKRGIVVRVCGLWPVAGPSHNMRKRARSLIGRWVGRWTRGCVDSFDGWAALYVCTSKRNTTSHIWSINPTDSMQPPGSPEIFLVVAGHPGLADWGLLQDLDLTPSQYQSFSPSDHWFHIAPAPAKSVILAAPTHPPFHAFA